MAVYKEEKTNTWRVLYRYTDWNGERKQSQKRGFKTKREAQAWEREQLNKLGGDLNMNFKSFIEHYSEDMQTRLKENTWETKKHRLNITNGNLYRENEMLSKINSKLKSENENLRSEVKDYKLLRKVFGHKQIDNLLEQARNIKGHKRENPRSR